MCEDNQHFYIIGCQFSALNVFLLVSILVHFIEVKSWRKKLIKSIRGYFFAFNEMRGNFKDFHGIFALVQNFQVILCHC